MAKRAKKKTITQNRSAKSVKITPPQKGQALLRNLAENASAIRTGFLTKLLDSRRDIDVECGYPKDITIEQYKYMYEREGLAQRVVDLLPEDSWSMDPHIFEDEEQKETAFEEAWEALQAEKNLYHYMHRIDELSGVGRFGVLLLGLSDGGDLAKPVATVDGEGNVIGAENADLKLLYIRAFDESAVIVKSRVVDTKNPRYGHPLMYTVTFQETVGTLNSGQIDGIIPDGATTTTTTRTQDVHWSRIIHVADNRQMSEVYGTPRMEDVFNRLMDIRKVLSGSGEMFWKGAFPGYAFEVTPEAAKDGAEIDADTLREEMVNYQNGLQRYLAITGVTVKSLDVQVADPKSHLESQIRYIAMAKGVPYRIFLGTEEAKLASTQDVTTWNKRVSRRQDKYLTPMLVRPLVDRLIAVGALPEPASGSYLVEWPDLNTPTDKDKAEVLAQVTEALAKYVAGSVDQFIPPPEYLRIFMGLNQDEIDAIMDAAEEQAGVDAEADDEQFAAEEERRLAEEERLRQAEADRASPVEG